jgi:uncharacterized protein (TIGR02266 family)
MRERRKNTRVALHADVDVSTGSNFFVGRAQDISSGGLFIQSDTLLDPGTEVQVKVRIPGRLFVIDCVVRWGLSSPDGKPIGYGVEFVDLTPPAKKAIETFMTTRDPLAFDGLEREQTMVVVRAFSYFSLLANLAEDLHNIRRARQAVIDGTAAPMPASVWMQMCWFGSRINRGSLPPGA